MEEGDESALDFNSGKNFPLDILVPHVTISHLLKYMERYAHSADSEYIQLGSSLSHFGLVKKEDMKGYKSFSQNFTKEKNEAG